MSCVKIQEIIREFFDNQNWHYSYDDQNSVFSILFDVDSDKIKYVKYSIFVFDDHATSIMYFPLIVEDKQCAEISEFINRVNFLLDVSGWEFNPESHEIRFKTNVFIQEIDSDQKTAIKRLITLPYQMLREFGNYLVKIISGVMTAKDAVDEILKN